MPTDRSVFVVGAGAVGLGLARALLDAGWDLVGLWNRGSERRERARQVVGAAARGGELGFGIERAGLVLVCVSDAAVATVGAQLTARGNVVPGTVVAHTAGCLPAAALGAIPGAHVGGLHPLVAVPASADAAEVLRGAPFGIEGSAEALAAISAVVDALGGHQFEVPSVGKARYHAAAVMASNLVVALLHDAIAEADAAGVGDADTLLTQLATGAIDRIREGSASAALTGPVMRGDTATIERHLDALGPEAAAVYRTVSERALAIARTRGLTPGAATVVEQLLLRG